MAKPKNQLEHDPGLQQKQAQERVMKKMATSDGYIPKNGVGCKNCGKRLANSSSLAKHMALVHGA